MRRVCARRQSLREDALGALSPELLPALDRLRRASGVENESVSVGLVLDLHLWSLADDETQSAHAKYLHSLGKDRVTVCDITCPSAK